MTAEQLKSIIRDVVREELEKALAPFEHQVMIKTLNEIIGLRSDLEELNRRLQDRDILRQLAERDGGSEIRF